MTLEGYFAICPVALIIIAVWLIVTRHDVSATPTREEKSGMLFLICVGTLLWPLTIPLLVAGLLVRITRKGTNADQQN